MTPQFEPSKPRMIPVNPYLKRASVLNTVADPCITDSCETSNILVLSHALNESFEKDNGRHINAIRKADNEARVSTFVVVSLVDVRDFLSEAFTNACRFVYMNGCDAILINASVRIDDVRSIRKNALGLRGRRVKILVDGNAAREVSNECDGVFVARDSGFDASICSELLGRQKLLFTRDVNLTDSCMVDILVTSPEEEMSFATTPATTVPSTPLVTSARVGTTAPLRSFLFKELMKFVTPSTRLIISLSDDGAAVAELSAVSRIQKCQIPPILGLSASESVTRYMTCLYGVIPLQTQSFISVASVVKNAIEFALDRSLIQVNDQVVVVTQPPPVTASTNESCFEGVVFSQTVAIKD